MKLKYFAKFFLLSKIALLLVCSSLLAGTTRETYTNRAGTVIARGYTNGKNTYYVDPLGRPLGYSRQKSFGTNYYNKHSTFQGSKGINGTVRDSYERPQGNVTTKKR